MATDVYKELCGEVLSLSEADADAADAWDRELTRRLAEVDAGTAVIVDRDEFRRRIQAHLAAN